MSPFTVICCPVLRREMAAVLGRDYPEARPVFIDSMLHMHPGKLRRILEETLSGLPDQDVLLVYGDCHAHMREMERQPRRRRTDGINCADLLLGRDAYARFRKEKVFLFLPEWAERWREVFQKELGFSDPVLAREFMRETRDKLVYLDTGVLPAPEQALVEIAAHFGMPVARTPVSLDHLRAAVRLAAKRLERRCPDEH